jgi:hypothetical protein
MLVGQSHSWQRHSGKNEVGIAPADVTTTGFESVPSEYHRKLFQFLGGLPLGTTDYRAWPLRGGKGAKKYLKSWKIIGKKLARS